MISPELLRRYPFFACLDDAEQKAVAMASEDVTCSPGTMILQEGQPASTLYMLCEGVVQLVLSVPMEKGQAPKEWIIGDINPGEPFGISALIAGQSYTSSARAGAKSRLIKVDAQALRSLCEHNYRLGYCMMQQVARAALERLQLAQTQLAAAQS